jgi:AraC-like DNA-binding protein
MRQSIDRLRQFVMGPSSLSSSARLIARSLTERGIDAEALFRRAKVSYAELDDPNARYPLAAVHRLWALADEVTRDPCFGLDVGRAWHPTSFHALGYAALASATLREALGYVVRYARVVNSGARVDLVDRGGEIMLTLGRGFREPAFAPFVSDSPVQAGLAAIVVLCRQARGHAVDLRRVTLEQDERNGAHARMQGFFGCPVVFGAGENALVFRPEELDAPLSSANAVLAQINARALEDYLARLESPALSDRVRARLVRSLPAGNVEQSAMARTLNMSLRSMQRKLNREGTSFRALLDDTRRQLARQYLGDATMSLAEVAYLLGFSEASSLARAMRRWRQGEAQASAAAA